jgi:hypothetical protein
LIILNIFIKAGFLPDGSWRAALLYSTFITTVLLGGWYAYVWGRKAIGARKTI